LNKFILNKSRWIYPVLFQLLILLGWFITVKIGLTDQFILPDPVAVFTTFCKIFPQIREHLIVTALEAVGGLLIAASLSLPLGWLMDRVNCFRQGFYPLLVISQTIPIIVIAPLIIMWFGFGLTSKIAVVILICIFPIALSFYEGLNKADIDQINLLKTMGANQLQIFRHIKFPSALPSFFTGFKIAATYSVMGAVISEWLGGEKGLGVYMLRVRYSFDLNKVFAVTIYIIILSLLLVYLCNLAGRMAMPWQKYLQKEE